MWGGIPDKENQGADVGRVRESVTGGPCMACIKGCGRLKQSQGGPPMVCVEARRPLLGGLGGAGRASLLWGARPLLRSLGLWDPKPLRAGETGGTALRWGPQDTMLLGTWGGDGQCPSRPVTPVCDRPVGPKAVTCPTLLSPGLGLGRPPVQCCTPSATGRTALWLWLAWAHWRGPWVPGLSGHTGALHTVLA